MKKLYDTYLKRFVIRVGTVFIGGAVAFALQDGSLDASDLESKALSGAIAAGFYALVALISPGEPSVGVKPDVEA